MFNFIKIDNSRPYCINFRQILVNICLLKLQMAGFKPGSSGVRSDRDANCATQPLSTSIHYIYLNLFRTWVKTVQTVARSFRKRLTDILRVVLEVVHKTL